MQATEATTDEIKFAVKPGTYSYKKIPYPERESEFEVQMFLVKELRRMGMDARAEVTCESMRFDIVIFDERKQATRIIELKKAPISELTPVRKHQRSMGRSRINQVCRYRDCGLKVDVIAGMPNARLYVNLVQKRGFEFKPKYREMYNGEYVLTR